MDQDGTDLADGGRPAFAERAGNGRVRLPRPVRGVVFDLDGTLLDTEGLYRRAFHDSLAELGWSLGSADYNRLIGLPSEARRAMLPRMLGRSFPVECFLAAYYRHRGIALARAVPIKPGVTAVLDLLDWARLPYAIATSASAATASANLAGSGLLGRFPIVVTRDTARGKPAPDSFLLAAELLGLRPADCLAIEDSDAGITAAHRAGCMVAAIPDAVMPQPAMLEWCVACLPTLHHLVAMLQPMPTSASASTMAAELTRRNNRLPSRV